MSIHHFAMRAALPFALLLAAIPSGRAATSTAAVSVSAMVAPTCRLGSPTDGSGAEARGHRLAVACEASVPYTLTYDDAPRSRSEPDDQAPGRVAATITY